jgi:hypothetical protein
VWVKIIKPSIDALLVIDALHTRPVARPEGS